MNKSIVAIALLTFAILACRPTNKPVAGSWAKARVLADKEDHPSRIVTDGDAVYYVTGGTVVSQHEGTNNIKKISLKDGSVSIVVKGGDTIPDTTLALDEKYLYWSDGGNIMRVPKDGGASEKIVANAPKPDEIVMDDDNIYWLIWTGEGSPPQPIMFAPKRGGEPKQLTPPQPPTTGLSLDRDFVYWMTGSGLKKIAKAGGPITDVFHDEGGGIVGLIQDRENFYFSDHDGGKSALRRFRKSDGTSSDLAGSINYTMQLVVDESFVYYFDNVRGQGSFGPVALMKVSKSGGTPVEIDSGNAGWIRYLAMDAKQIYLTDISKVYAIAK